VNGRLNLNPSSKSSAGILRVSPRAVKSYSMSFAMCVAGYGSEAALSRAFKKIVAAHPRAGGRAGRRPGTGEVRCPRPRHRALRPAGTPPRPPSGGHATEIRVEALCSRAWLLFDLRPKRDEALAHLRRGALNHRDAPSPREHSKRLAPVPPKSSGPFTSCLYLARTSAQTTRGFSRFPPQWKLPASSVLPLPL
jgi:hypothetical protein